MNWKKLWIPSKKWWLFGLPIGAFLAALFGVMAWGAFNWTLEITNTEEFCISCHEMQDNAFQEYKTTSHYQNRVGVKASCPECHVPKPWVHKVVRKIEASREVWHTLLGTIDTPEKYDAHREKMAQRVWAQMKATDSRECRNCHAFETMDLTAQSKRAQKNHDPSRIAQSGDTCIDCHKGIAHQLP